MEGISLEALLFLLENRTDFSWKLLESLGISFFKNGGNPVNRKLVIESELLSTRIFLAKVTPKIGQEKYLLLILC